MNDTNTSEYIHEYMRIQTNTDEYAYMRAPVSGASSAPEPPPERPPAADTCSEYMFNTREYDVFTLKTNTT